MSWESHDPVLKALKALHDTTNFVCEELAAIKREIRHMDAQTQAGLAALNTVDTGIATAVSSAVADIAAQNTQIATLTAQLAVGQTPDPDVLAGINAATTANQATLSALQAALPAPPAPPSNTTTQTATA